MQYWEDLSLGAARRFGEHRLTVGDIEHFAARFRLPGAARCAPDVAPGYLLCCIGMRLLVDHQLSGLASLGSPGLDLIDWPRLATVGECLHLRARVIDARVLRSRPHMGLVRQRLCLCNEHGAPVARMWTNALVARRDGVA